jgi:hypothetical protein
LLMQATMVLPLVGHMLIPTNGRTYAVRLD